MKAVLSLGIWLKKYCICPRNHEITVKRGINMNLEEKIVKELKNRGYTISTAESCTGGLLAGRLLNVSGASEVFNEGYITYSNEAKQRLVYVSPSSLQLHGAVSFEVAQEMAIGVQQAAKAQVGLSTTGIAGPGGGTPEKPVGLVYVACAIEGKAWCKECRFHGDREENRRQAVEEALQLLWENLY